MAKDGVEICEPGELGSLSELEQLATAPTTANAVNSASDLLINFITGRKSRRDTNPKTKHGKIIGRPPHINSIQPQRDQIIDSLFPTYKIHEVETGQTSTWEKEELHS